MNFCLPHDLQIWLGSVKDISKIIGFLQQKVKDKFPSAFHRPCVIKTDIYHLFNT